MEKDLKKLNRTELVELLRQMRETIDALSEENQSLRARAESAESKCAQLEQRIEDDASRKADDEALRSDMRQVIEKIELMGSTIMHCGEADRRIKAAQIEAAAMLDRAQAEANAMRDEAEQDIFKRKEAFTRQCEELLRGQETLRRLMEN